MKRDTGKTEERELKMVMRNQKDGGDGDQLKKEQGGGRKVKSRVFVERREIKKSTHAKTEKLCRCKDEEERHRRYREGESERVRIRANFKACIELMVAAPEDLSRIALALPPWPINVKLSGSREAIRLWKRKTH